MGKSTLFKFMAPHTPQAQQKKSTGILPSKTDVYKDQNTNKTFRKEQSRAEA